MNKKSIAILLVACSFASSAFATGFVNKLITKNNSATLSTIQTHKTTKQTNRSYTDFSGTWIGNCGNGENFTTVIENDATYITLDGAYSRIGQGLQGMAESNEKYVSYEHNSFEWNADGSALIVKLVDISKDNIDNSAMQTNVGTFTLTMKNGQINFDGKGLILEDLTHNEPLAIHCEFNKKQ